MPSKATKSTNKKPDKSIPSSSTTIKHPKPANKKPIPSASNKPPIKPSPTEFDLASPAQQSILDVFSTAFEVDDTDALKGRVQRVKGYLYARQFGEAFGGREELREAYAIRWSPGRAVGYAGVFSGLGDVLGLHGKDRGGGGDPRGVCTQGKGEDGLVIEQEGHSRQKIVCVGGGGGAELVALARHLAIGMESDEGKRQDEKASRGLLGEGVDCVLVDVADWKGVTEKLMGEVDANLPGPTRPDKESSGFFEKRQQGEGTLEDELGDITISSTPPVPTPQPQPLLSTESVQADILTLPPAQLRSLFSSAHLVTIMFTLNELYTASSTLTTTFLLSLTDVLAPGAMLLVLDSPGSYSTVGVGADGRERKYPMAWLLDHTFLVSAGGAQGTGRKDAEEGKRETKVSESGVEEKGEEVRQRGGRALSVKRQKWVKVEECDSRWCRLAKGLRYPIELEDMRYQLHLYRRV